MKITTSVLAIVAAIALTGFSPKYSTEELSQKLIQSWVGHSERDEEFQKTFFALVGKVVEQNPEVRERLESYKTRLSITDDQMLVNLIFLLRRAADKDSFYAGMEKWNSLPETTRVKVMGHFGSTYKAVTSGTVESNKNFLELLGKRNTARGEVVVGLPAAFQDAISFLDESEVEGYLDSLYLMMLNTVSVMNFLGHAEETKDDL